MRKSSIVILLAVFAINLGLWALFNRPSDPEQAWSGLIKGVSFSPFRQGQDPSAHINPTPKEIDEDLRLLKGKVTSVRTYTSLDGIEAVPQLATKYGLNVTMGAWLDNRFERNDEEIISLIKTANRHPKTVKRVIVGNEAILRGDMTVDELGAYLDYVRQNVSCPISTAEPWHVWIKNPELAEHVDFIAIHVLPYWEKVPVDKAMDWVDNCYRQVVAAFPNKQILISEVGWPSGGERRGKSKASITNEAKFLLRFLPMAAKNNIDYFIMEAFDQPWKRPFEGVVGGHWGIFDVKRQLKIPFSGPILERPIWPYQWAASLLGLVLVFFYLRRRFHQPYGARFFFALLMQMTTSVFIWTLFAPLTSDFLWTETLAWAMLLPMQAGLLIVVLINGFEMSEMLWTGGLKRRWKPLAPKADTSLPKVSIHVPLCQEPPEMVMETLNSLAALDYHNFEVLVIDNNTPEPEFWQPVKTHCEKLGSRFRFFHLEKWPGFKAGALNYALTQTADDASVVAVVDSDYVVRPDWLKSLVPYFQRTDVAIVQAPQDHREWEDSAFKEMCNWEYSGFFDIGMIHRNEANAIIQHGTMTLIRKSALKEVGGWGEWCICEDAELGLRILSKGLDSIYVRESFGKGLTPDSFNGYKKQRFRWAYGAVQILKRHWRLFIPGNEESRLTTGQRYHFIAGWLPWFADSLNYLITLASLFWTIGILVLPRFFGTPLHVFLLPPLGAFLFKLIHFLSLYQARVRCGVLGRMGAAVAGMSLTHTIAKAVLTGIFTSQKPFLRTPKCEKRRAVMRGIMMAWEEVLFFAMLCLAAVSLVLVKGIDDPEILTWAGVLLIQSIPYAAALFASMASIIPALLPSPLAKPALIPVDRLGLPGSPTAGSGGGYK